MSPSRPRAAMRTGGARALVVLGCLLLLLANFTVWLNRTVVSTDGWVDTVGPLSKDDDVAVAVSEGLTRRIAARVDFEEIAAESLPERAQALVGPVGQAVRGFVADAIRDIIVSDRFNQFWVEANRRAHEAFIRLMEDETRIGERAEEVTLRLDDVLQRVDERLEARGLDLFDGDVPDDVGDLELFGQGRVEKLRTGFDLLTALDWALPLVTLLVFGAALALSARRRRTAIEIGVGGALTMAVAAIAVRIARNGLLGDIRNDQVRAAADSVWDQVRTGIVQQTAALFVLGVLVAIGFWITGSAPRAVRLREWGRRQLAGIREGRLDSGRAAGLGAFLRDHRRAVQGGALTLVVLLLLLLPRVTALGLLVATALLALVAVAVELLAGPRRAPGDPPGGTAT
jgi:hypothetical protein